MVSKKINFLIIAVAFCLALSSFVMALQQTMVTIDSVGSITQSISSNFIVIGSGASASAVENGGLHRTTSGATVSVINTVLGWMSSNQKTEFVGNFSIGSSVTISKSIITLDFGTSPRAVITSSVQNAFIPTASHITIRGGDFSGGNDLIIAGGGGSATYLILDSIKLHDVSDEAVNFNNGGYNVLINCELYNAPQTLLIGSSAGHSLISGNNFHHFGQSGSRHGIYVDHSTNNEFVNNTFHDPTSGGAGILLKGGSNLIHNNEFYNMPQVSAPPISMYSQYSGVSNNQIYDNNFHDCYEAITIGNAIDGNPSNHTCIYNNTFQSLTRAIWLPSQTTIGNYDDIRIYYNRFISCATPIKSEGASRSLVTNTVIAYNTFSSAITNPAIQTFTNTMVYGNTGLADFNVPVDKTVPPP